MPSERVDAAKETPKPYERTFQCCKDVARVNDRTGGLAGHEVRAIRSGGFAELLKSEIYRHERAAAIGRAQSGEQVRLKFDLQDTAMSPQDEAAFGREAEDLRRFGIEISVIGVQAANATRANQTLNQSHRIEVVTQQQTYGSLTRDKSSKAATTPHLQNAA